MTDFEYEILQFIRTFDGNPRWIDVLNAFLPSHRDGDANRVLEILLSDGTLENASPSSRPPRCTLKLSGKAFLLLLEDQERREKLRLVQQENERKEKEQQQADEQKEQDRFHREQSCKEADRKAEHAFQYKLTFLNAFLTFASGLISGAILANLDRLIPWVLSLFP